MNGGKLIESSSAYDVRQPKCPRTLTEAIEKAWNLLTQEKIGFLREFSLHDSRTALHLTVGHKLRHELGLWGTDVDALFDDIMTHMPRRLVLNADMASDALIEVLSNEVQLRT